MSENKHGNRQLGGYHPLCRLPRPHSGHVISRPWGQSSVECFGEPKSAPATKSGYTHCACRDCMDITVSSDISKPELCSDCQEAGCVNHGHMPNLDDMSSGAGVDCQREDAYSV